IEGKTIEIAVKKKVHVVNEGPTIAEAGYTVSEEIEEDTIQIGVKNNDVKPKKSMVSKIITFFIPEKESKPDDSIIMETEQDIKDSNKQKSIFKRFIDWLKR
ncbi:MAG: hypothetical protein KAK00_07910, partial [Nanoarchaeota archaeon]|nr:hypothetical protein [Nanoarchaeota archaeon]